MAENKTLDEVIDAFERQWICPSNDEADEYCELYAARDEAINYLKMYRSEKAMWEADRKGYLAWIEQYKEAREKHQQAVIELKKNPPLTWDQIKEMDRKGRPIWFEWAEEDQVWKYWCFVSRWKGKQKQILEVMDSEGDYHEFYQEMIGTDWNAFRKENAWK